LLLVAVDITRKLKIEDNASVLQTVVAFQVAGSV